jgi:hypothetical protein
MHEWLVAITNGTVLVIDAMVLVIIAIGTIQGKRCFDRTFS